MLMQPVQASVLTILSYHPINSIRNSERPPAAFDNQVPQSNQTKYYRIFAANGEAHINPGLSSTAR